MAFIDDTILIRGKKIPVRHGELDQRDLRFYPDNPRIYSIVRVEGYQPTQEEIQGKLLEREHVKQLIHDIKLNKGLMDPVIVKNGSFEVLEGNSRLAAYRALAEQDPIKWGKIRCTLLPKDIDEATIFALLGQYHIKGKKDWAPYEQAGFLYRRNRQQNIPIKTLAEELGIGAREAERLINTYNFMVVHKENKLDRWSYYEEYLKSTKVKKARDAAPELDDLIVDKIKSGEISKAVDVRDKLPAIIGVGKEAFKKFLRREIEFEEAYEIAEAQGGTHHAYLKMNRFRQWLVKEETEETLEEANAQVKRKMLFELEKIKTQAGKLSKKLKS